jgi:pimeloyl-ACP methyl ester carboxylesterase
VLILLSIAVFLVIAYVMMRFLLHRAFYHRPVPMRYPPEKYGLSAREVAIPTEKNKRLQVFMINENKGAAIVVGIHGWENTVEKLIPLSKNLIKDNLGVVLVNARNHGGSDPDSYSTMVMFADDVIHVLDYLRREVGKEIPVYLLGHSLGAATSIYVASLRNDISGVISVSAFADLYRIIADGFLREYFPGFLLHAVMGYLAKAIGKDYNTLSPMHAIRRSDCPVLILHGTEDKVVPVRDAELLAENAGNERAKLVLIDAADHTSLLTSPVLMKTVAGFIRSVISFN